jgi:hypothetical protein
MASASAAIVFAEVPLREPVIMRGVERNQAFLAQLRSGLAPSSPAHRIVTVNCSS